MIIGISVAIVLLALAIVPLALTGDAVAFVKRYAVILGIGIVSTGVGILVYMISEKLPIRRDLTAEKKYSVDQGLVNIMTRLDDQVMITYYTSSSLQAFLPYKIAMIDKLNEIKNASKGWVDFKVEEVDKKDEKLMQELMAHRMIGQVPSSGNDDFSLSILISGLKLTYKDLESSYVPQIIQSTQLELELADQLQQLYYKDKPTEKPIVAVNVPPPPPGSKMPGQPQRGSGFEWLTDESQRININTKKFDVKSVEMNQNSSIPEKTSTLIMIRPNLKDERQKYDVEKYLAEGGHVLLIASPIRTFGETVEQTPFGLEAYLKDCGISLGTSIIADRSHLSVPARNQVYELPYFIKIKPENIDQTTSLTRLMSGLVMPTSTEIQLDEPVLNKNGITWKILAKTTPQNWELKTNRYGGFDKEDTPKDTASLNNPPRYVFAMFKGRFPFPYEGKGIPEWPPAPGDKEKDKDKPKPAPGTATANKREGTLVICSSPEAFYGPYFEQQMFQELTRANVTLLTNLIENLSYGDDLIGLRAKQYETRTLAKLPPVEKEKERAVWKFALIVGMPILTLLFAIYRFVLRRMNQLNYERTFAGTTGPSSFSA